jgi:hypothetical protein
VIGVLMLGLMLAHVILLVAITAQLLVVLGQQPVTTEVGIFNLVLQGGAFALLSWIAIFWLPKASSRLSESYETGMKAQAEAIRQADASHKAEVDNLLKGFKEEIKYEREQDAGQHKATMEIQARTLEAVARGQQAVADALHQIGLQVKTHHDFSQEAVKAISEAGRQTAAVAAKVIGGKLEEQKQ